MPRIYGWLVGCGWTCIIAAFVAFAYLAGTRSSLEKEVEKGRFEAKYRADPQSVLADLQRGSAELAMTPSYAQAFGIAIEAFMAGILLLGVASIVEGQGRAQRMLAGDSTEGTDASADEKLQGIARSQ